MALILNSSNIIPCPRFFTGSSAVLVSSSSPAAQYVSTTTIAVFVTAPTPVTRLHMKSPPKPKCFSVVMKQRACIIVVKASSSSGIDGGDATSSSSSSSSSAAVPVENLPLESKLQVKVDRKLRMKLAKKMRLRRKRLVRKRQMRKKGRWPPSKVKLRILMDAATINLGELN